MSDSLSPSDDVLAYYDTGVELERLSHGEGALELARTKEIIARFLEPGSTLADIGGADGRYADWLADGGHQVELVEPVALHVEQARERAGDPPRFGVHLADARSLPFEDESFDAVLLLGPLYHLGGQDDRHRAVREAARVCRPGGVVFAAAISRLTPLLDAIRGGWIGNDPLFANIRAETLHGRRVPAEHRTSTFPDAYFHRPDELEAELASAGLDVHAVHGIEGPAWLLDDVDAMWNDERTRERMLWAARELETDPHALALSAHLLGVATRPATVDP